MSKLREKSEFNILAANILLKQSLFAPSIHCSYYSCFQLMKFTIKYFFGEDYDTQVSNISNSLQGSHSYVISLMYKELTSLSNLEESRKFKRKIMDLKLLRAESDYDNIEIDFEKSDLAFKKANELRTYIINQFNL